MEQLKVYKLKIGEMLTLALPYLSRNHGYQSKWRDFFQNGSNLSGNFVYMIL